MPAWTLWAGLITVGGLTGFSVIDIADMTDASANVGAYESTHAVSKTLATPHVVDRTLYEYRLQIDGEHGANFVAGLNLVAVVTTLAVPS
jgi:hypothetical protein